MINTQDKDRVYLKLIRKYWEIVFAKQKYMSTILNAKTQDLIQFKELTRQQNEIGEKMAQIGVTNWLLESDKPSDLSYDKLKEHLNNTPTYYADLGIHEERKQDKQKIEVNGVEYIITYDCYQFIEHIKRTYRDDRFHMNNELMELSINTYPNIKFQRKNGYSQLKELFEGKDLQKLQKILFESLGTPKGYWRCKIDIWLK
tara:strand:- start:3393 stop:3995 length:603 start_codon:yes stop_codon:yes gene_type:complete